MIETIQNSFLTISVNSYGAELCSICNNKTGWEYLWQADPTYWKRHSPVLFPIVGSVWNGKYRENGLTYSMSQHGFARDMEFVLIKHTDNELRYRLVDNEVTHEKYPYCFELEIGYRLIDSEIQVMWQVHNPADIDMNFQIGAHPAFNFKNYDEQAEVQGYFALNPQTDSLQLTVIGEKGCVVPEKKNYELPNGEISIRKTTFNGDALVFENNQVNEVTLMDASHKPYVQLSFDAPVVGLWSPAQDSYAPFVCIEPWYGRCDTVNYTDSFQNKDWMQHLAPKGTFNSTYSIKLI